METYRANARIAGTLFLVAMATSLTGGLMLENLFSAPLPLAPEMAAASPVRSGVFLEMINALSVIGIAAVLFPVIKREGEAVAAGYLGMRILESVSCVAAASIPFLLISKAEQTVPVQSILFAARSGLTGIFIPLFFSLGALLFYATLYRGKLIPRFISVWGFVGALLILVLNAVEAGVAISALLALPIILNEMFLGVWLFAKGFGVPATQPPPALHS